MKKLNLEILRKLGACDEAVEIYKMRQEKDPIKAIELLIDGCDELDGIGNRERLEWANWFMVRLLSDSDKIRYAIFAAEQVLGIFEKAYPNDKRPREAIEAAKAYLDGNIKAAAAYAAAYAAYAAAHAVDAAHAAADAAYAAAHAAYAVDAAYAVAYAAAHAAAHAAEDYDDMVTSILQHGVELLSGESD